MLREEKAYSKGIGNLIDILAHVHQQLLCAVKPEQVTTTHQNGSGLDLDLTGRRIRIQGKAMLDHKETKVMS